MRFTTPLLLCASISTDTIDELVPTLVKKYGATNHLCGLEALQAPLEHAWQTAWREQKEELASLDHVALEDASESQRLDLRGLWRASDNSTHGGVEQARCVTRRLMTYWRHATPRNDDIDEELRSDILLRETMTRETALAERRRQLRRHADAGCVEYRIFGEVLSRDAAALNALDAELETLSGAWRQLGGVARRTGWAETLEAAMDERKAARQWLEDEQLLARVGNGSAPWQRWWVLPPLQRACDSAVCAGYAFAEGATQQPAATPLTQPTRSSSSAQRPSAGGLSSVSWLALLGETLKRSSSTRLNEQQESNLFPLLLMVVSVARQGHTEAAAIYVLARTLGSLNAAALRTREGFGASSFPERDVSLVEGMNTEQKIVAEALALFEQYFASYSVETYSLYFLFSLPIVLPLLLLYLTSEALVDVFDLLSVIGRPDPLDF